ncbi:MAG: SagB family peptide dehydrogenase, partial [Gammaproteobacteria bacterium]
IYHPDKITPHAITLDSIGILFELAMGLSAWKVHGQSRWALRCNPSSGNLHPTESYLVFSGINNLAAGVYHYNSYQHNLEQRCIIQPHQIPKHLPEDSFLIGLSSIHWREAWKYGERAFRYCQHDVGHAMASFRYAAATLGWHVHLLEQSSDDQISSLLGLNRAQDFINAEHETADVLLQITTAAEKIDIPHIEPLCNLMRHSDWQGSANCLSPNNQAQWPVIDEISRTCHKPVTEPEMSDTNISSPISDSHCDLKATTIIQQRRSAQAFDAISTLPLNKFYRILDSLLVRLNTPPFDILPWPPRIHLLLFIHRVEQLEPGLYALARSSPGEHLMRHDMRNEFTWEKALHCPEHIPLYQLVSSDCREAAQILSCHQDIASDGSFSLAMLAEFETPIEEKPWCYRQLFWESGIIGQALYLEAEAEGISGTGIGCFFDDAVHNTLGIETSKLQSLYHFTLGKAVVDNRLLTEPPYAHLIDRTAESQD